MTGHALIYLLAYAGPGLMGFFSFGIYTRVLTPSEYAVYSVGVSVAFLIGNVIYGWLRFSLGRYQAESPETNFLPFVLTCFGAITILFMPIAAAVAHFSWPALSFAAIGAILLMTAAQALFDITQETRRARRLSSSFARISLSRSFLSFTLGTAGAFLFHQGSAVVVGIAVGFAVIAAMSLGSMLREPAGERIEMRAVRRFTRYGLPLALSGLVFSGNSTLARVIVGYMLGSAAAGHFGAAMDVTNQLTGIVASAIAAILGPVAIRAHKEHGPAEAKARLADGVELFLAAIVPTVVGLVLVADTFSDLIAGNAFEAAVAQLMPLLAISRGLNVFAQFYLHLGFQIVERPLRQVVCGAATLLVNCVASYVLIQYYGLIGAAYGILIGDLVGVVVSILMLRGVFPMPIPLKSTLKVLACSAAMAVACLLLKEFWSPGSTKSLIGTILLGGSTYVVAAYAVDVADFRTKIVPNGLRRLRGRRGS